jgi:SAM-dependent methyltransferase
VGREPLSAIFASFGCQVVASDLQAESEMSKYWASASQWCSGLEAINERKICEDGAFRSLVSYRHVDMNHIPEDLVNFDFNWSSCSFEHLGSIELGLRFLKNQLQTLKPGGWAVHTTEYNISSNDDTLEEPNCVIFRQRDIDKIVAELRAEGHYVEELDYSLGWFPLDYKVDLPPYNGGPHLRLLVSNYICTSIGLIIRKKM